MLRPDDRKVSIADELANIRLSVDAVRMLTFAYVEEQTGYLEDCNRAPQVISALTAMISTRLRQVERVAAGYSDPRTILAWHNEADDGPTPDGNREVRLRVWADENVMPKRSRDKKAT